MPSKLGLQSRSDQSSPSLCDSPRALSFLGLQTNSMNQQIIKSTIANLNMLHCNPSKSRCQERTFIYALNDPVTGICRYIGKTDDPEKRLRQHLSPSEKPSHKRNWIRSLLADGLSPIFEILREVPISGWEVWERAFIEVYRERGIPLTNQCNGGEGPSGRSTSLETRAKLSSAAKVNYPRIRQKLLDSRLGKPHSPEHRAKISAAHLGKKLSSDHCAKMSAANKGKTLSLEVREKISAAMRGRRLSPETKKKLSIATRSRYARHL